VQQSCGLVEGKLALGKSPPYKSVFCVNMQLSGAMVLGPGAGACTAGACTGFDTTGAREGGGGGGDIVGINCPPTPAT